MRVGRWVVFCAPLLLCGCVTVDLTVKGNGTVIAELAVAVPQRTAEGVKDIAQRYLGQGWSVRLLGGKGEQRTVYAWRKVRGRWGEEQKVMPGVTVQVRRRTHWFRATYEVTLRYDPAELLPTPDERRLAGNQSVTVRVHLPGRLVPERSTLTPADGNWASLTLDPTQPTEVRLTAVGVLWWRVGLLVVVLAAALWFAAPYVPRVLDRFSRRTVRVVQQ